MPGASRSRSRRRARTVAGLSPPGRAAGLTARSPGDWFDAHLHLSRYWPDPTVNRYGPELDFTLPGLLREMDAAGIGQGLVLQVNESPSVEANLREGEAVYRESGGRLLRTTTVDPTRGPGAVHHAIALWENAEHLAGIKFYPGYQHFYPHDRRLDPVYEFAAKRGLVVLFHQGDTLDPHGLLKFARPIEVDEVAVRYPEVRFVLCHFGNPWFDEAAELVFKNSNVYADTSGLLWPPTSPRFDRMFERVRECLQGALSGIGSVHRVLYGSDWPLESLGLATRLIDSLDLSSEDRSRILGGNARKLFGLA